MELAKIEKVALPMEQVAGGSRPCLPRRMDKYGVMPEESKYCVDMLYKMIDLTDEYNATMMVKMDEIEAKWDAE